jgi:hypothetical protein
MQLDDISRIMKLSFFLMFSKEQTEKALRLSVLDIFHPAHAIVQYVPIINSKPATAPDRGNGFKPLLPMCKTSTPGPLERATPASGGQ